MRPAPRLQCPNIGMIECIQSYFIIYFTLCIQLLRGGGTGTASTAVAVPLLWRMRLSRTKIGAILMTSLRLALALTPAAQTWRKEQVPYHRSSAPTKTRAVPSTLALSWHVAQPRSVPPKNAWLCRWLILRHQRRGAGVRKS